jgi:hypothetical protein
MINIGTQVFQRIVMEAREAGLKEARAAGIRALTDTMHQETVRFCTFSREYVEGCATDRMDFFLNDPQNANILNQVFPSHRENKTLPA